MIDKHVADGGAFNTSQHIYSLLLSAFIIDTVVAAVRSYCSDQGASFRGWAPSNCWDKAPRLSVPVSSLSKSTFKTHNLRLAGVHLVHKVFNGELNAALLLGEPHIP